MKKMAFAVIGIIAIALGIYRMTNHQNKTNETESSTAGPVHITPISHATAILVWNGTVMYTDPVGATNEFAGKPAANIIFLTDIHSDHFNIDTLNAVIGSATLVVPQAVKDELPPNLAARATVLHNGDKTDIQGFTVLAMPMYNLPESPTSPHTKGRGNGYLIEKGEYRVYIAGDTSGIPEMRALKDIDVAFLPMNLPYTMGVEEAADAVLAFKPKHVYPYHYRGPDGLSDINKFKALVNAGDPSIDVVLLNWYPQQ